MMKKYRKKPVIDLDKQKERNMAWFRFQKPPEVIPDETERNTMETPKETHPQGNFDKFPNHYRSTLK